MLAALVRLAGGMLIAATLQISQAAPTHTLVVIPKLVGISYYDAVKQGIDLAATELPDLQVIWAGPTLDRVEKQIELVEHYIPSHPDVIAVAANDPVAIVPVLQQAQAAGIHVMSWDGDTDLREFFVNLVDYQAFGTAMVDALVEQMGHSGEVAIITTTFYAPNQSNWIAAIKSHLYAHDPGLKIVDIRPAGESSEESYRVTRDLLNTNPQLKGLIALGAPNLPGAARALEEAGLAGKVALVGNSTPNQMRPYLKRGVVHKVLLWNAPDHGYLTVYSAYNLLQGKLHAGQPFAAGHLGLLTPRGDDTSMQVSLPVLVFTRDNVDQYDF